MNPSRPRSAPAPDATDLDASLAELVEPISPDANADQITEILATGVRLGLDDTDRLDLKITNAALKEMRAAFRTFAPYEGVSKVTIFGSARTLPEDPLYEQTRNLASAMADEGWMVITGAGPGIMQAGMEGAGRQQSIGVSIRLPFESEANEIIAGDDKLISMKYFFTRKLMLIKESKGFVCHARRVRHARRDVRGAHAAADRQGRAGADRAARLPRRRLLAGARRLRRRAPRAPWPRVRRRPRPGAASPTTSRSPAASWSASTATTTRCDGSGRRLVLRLRALPSDAELADLNERFGHLLAEGSIERSGPLAARGRRRRRARHGPAWR